MGPRCSAKNLSAASRTSLIVISYSLRKCGCGGMKQHDGVAQRCRHRSQFAINQSRLGCIARQREEIDLRRRGETHRLQFRPVKCVFELMALMRFLWAALVTHDEPLYGLRCQESARSLSRNLLAFLTRLQESGLSSDGYRRPNRSHHRRPNEPAYRALPSSRHRRTTFAQVLRVYGDGET